MFNRACTSPMKLLHSKPVPLSHLVTVFILLAAASAFLYQSRLDMWLAHQIYDLEGGHGGGFPLTHNYWLYNVMHEDARYLVKRIFFITLGLAIAGSFIERLKPARSALWYIVLAALLSTSLISWLKGVTKLPCPQDLVAFGGQQEWISFWKALSPQLPAGHCYPAGHASSGYGWLCLAFVFPYGSRAFRYAIIPGAAAGLLFGMVQQFRGEHFLSHDLMTIDVCWTVSGIIYLALRQLLGRKVPLNAADEAMQPQEFCPVSEEAS